MRLVFVGMLLFAGSSAMAETPRLASPRLADEELRRFVSGKTVHLDTAIGTIPITYHEDGLLSGKVSGLPLRAYLGSETDRGRWQVKGDKICQKFFRWLSGETACVAFRQEGRKISWRRDDGTSGTATIASNDATPPPAPLGLGIRTERPAPPPPADEIEKLPPVASKSAPLPQKTVALALPPAVSTPALEAQARLVEPLRRVSPPRPTVMLAAASMGGMALGPARAAPLAPPAASPFDSRLNMSRNALIELAFDTALLHAGRTWCHPPTTIADEGLPPLVSIALAQLADNPAGASGACMSADPHLLEMAKLGAIAQH